MKPMIILGPDVMSDAERKKLEENGICVVVASDPERVRFVDPIPCQSSRTEIENAAIKLSRILLNRQWGEYTTDAHVGVATIARIFADCLIKGTALDARGTREEQEQKFLETSRISELDKIAREEARKEAAEKKAEKLAELAKKNPK